MYGILYTIYRQGRFKGTVLLLLLYGGGGGSSSSSSSRAGGRWESRVICSLNGRQPLLRGRSISADTRRRNRTAEGRAAGSRHLDFTPLLYDDKIQDVGGGGKSSPLVLSHCIYIVYSVFSGLFLFSFLKRAHHYARRVFPRINGWRGR